jgi:hypothetical protein
MGEDGRAVAFDMLVEPNARSGLGQDRCERGLADFERIATEIVAVQLKRRYFCCASNLGSSNSRT